MFVDELEVTVRGGKGGDGCVSFRREKFAQRGGPDGGDGGDGGDVVLLPTTHCNTLYHLTGRTAYAAANGEPGMAANCSGRSAADLVLEVPVGTLVLDAGRGNVLKDLAVAGQPFVVARGGRGGKGNTRFATATNRSPQQAVPGGDGEQRAIRLSLKLIADVGMVGLPNAGKSTLLATLTRARPKIAGYPFTTLEPMLGIAAGPGDSSFVLADLPGLIAGASAGKGLGDRFLKHIERTRLLLHLVDCGDLALAPPVAAFHTIRAELARYSAALAARPALLVATKVEDEPSAARARELATAAGVEVLAISSATGQGLRELVVAIAERLRTLPAG
jgi:GTP-binding protein